MRSTASAPEPAALRDAERWLGRLLRIGVAGWLLVAAAHALLGTEGQAWLAWLPPCVFHALTGWPCPGCGMTRALLWLAEGRVDLALHAHPAVLPTAALLVATAIAPSAVARLGRALPTPLSALALVALLGVWLLRVGAEGPA